MEEERQRYAPAELPLDVLPGILSRVPAESLIRFKCVCKSWYRLIGDEGFVRSHLEHWRSAGHVVISGDHRPDDPAGREGKIYLPTLNLEDEEVRSHHDEICIDDCLVHALPLNVLRMPVQTDDVEVVFEDSCDGLVLLRIDDLRSTAAAWHLLVCNPITKWYMLLPPCPSFEITNFRWFIASDDPAQRYKIIGIKHYSSSESPSGWCFNLEFRRRESGSWKELPADIPWSGYLWVLPPSLSVGRKVHWLTVTVRYPRELVLLSLDLSTERLKPTEILNSPRYTAWDQWFRSHWAMCFGRRIQSSKEIELWILEDFDRPVWRKHHVVTNYPQGLEFPSKLYHRALLYMKEEDELIMRIGVGTFVYKMSSREWRRIAPPAEGHFTSMLANHHRPHVNSLVGWDGIIC